MNNRTQKVAVCLLIASFALSPLTSVLAQDVVDPSITTSSDQPVIDSSATVDTLTETSTTASSSDPYPDILVSTSTPAVSSTEPTGIAPIDNTGLTPTLQPQPEPVRAPPVKTKFKKDSRQPEQAQLAAVRQHLIDNSLPKEIVDRVDAYQAAEQQGPQQPGFFSKITDFVTGNTDAAKEQAKAEELAKKQPFKVDTYSGSINTAGESSYSQNFSNKQEKSKGLFQNIKNIFNNGTLKNLNFDNTENITPFAWLLGSKAFAVNDNPADYLAAGDEITFSQAIQDKADALNNNPLSILNFVRNNVTYIPYYGSKKGSDATLVERAGNDTDKASLLIAMLRYSSIPARYRQVDAKMDIGTVTDLLGVESAQAAAQVLSLEQIPYTLYEDSEYNPLFFVIEHTYVEAYIPYGYSRGANVNDGGASQWVPMDPSVNAYYYEQPIDTVSRMTDNGFTIQQFFDDYLNAGSSTLEPFAVFKNQATTYLASGSPTSTYDNALMRSYPKDQNLEFIPGSLPYEVAANLNTYDYIPTSMRHTIAFTVKNDQQTTVLSHTAYVSDLADRELLMTYVPATQNDQDTLDTFDTIYDVVPLSLVTVKPRITVNGTAIATGSATTTLGQAQSYTMVFAVPTRTIGGSINSSNVETVDRDVITGNTDAIALDTDHVALPELRPSEDTNASSSFVNNQVLYKTGVDFLYRLEQNQTELSRVVGGDFTDTASRATIFNGIDITYASSGQPYSFSWKGLRIDSSSKVKYFYRFNQDTTKHFKEFTGFFGLQASQEESDIFEENFDVQSVATVKGLKLVSSSTFSGVTLKKITLANESDIDSLSVSTSTRTVFHTAVQAGKTVYTPSAPVTYGTWNGLFYISIDFNGGTSAYTIGEGLNGGFSACDLPGIGAMCNWTQDAFDLLIHQAEASGNVGATIDVSTTLASVGETITATITYAWNFLGNVITWAVNKFYVFTKPGTEIIKGEYGATSTVSVTVAPTSTIGSQDDMHLIDTTITKYETEFEIPHGLLKAVIHKETEGDRPFDPKQYRYEPAVDYDNFSKATSTLLTSSPYSQFRIQGVKADGSTVTSTGSSVPGLNPSYTAIVKSYVYGGWALRSLVGYTGNQTFAQLLSLDTATSAPRGSQRWLENTNPLHPIQNPTNRNFTAQALLSASYGLGHVLYYSALNLAEDMNDALWFDTNPAKNIYDMVKIDTAVHLAASVLRYKHDHITQVGTDCGGWGDAVAGYNPKDDYRPDVCGKYYTAYNAQ